LTAILIAFFLSVAVCAQTKLREALKDEAYKLPEAQSKRGLSWLHRWMLAKGLPMKEEPGEPNWLRQN
jgi:hypothetical protein